MSTAIPLAEAKVRLSSVVQDVKGLGAEYVVTVRGVPSAMIAPVPKPAPEHPGAKGILAGRKPTGPRPSSGRAPPPPGVLSECVFVLSGRVYGFSRDEVADALSALLDEVDCEYEEAMRRALVIYRETALGFPDCILAARRAVEGVPVMTFGKKLAKPVGDLG